MATVAVIFGGMTGFLSAVAAMILFNASWLLALGLWSIGGLAVAAMLLVLMSGTRQAQPKLYAEHA